MIWVFLVVCLVVMITSFTIFTRRNGSHLAYPLWQFTLLVLGSVLGMYGAALSLMFIILS